MPVLAPRPRTAASPDCCRAGISPPTPPGGSPGRDAVRLASRGNGERDAADQGAGGLWVGVGGHFLRTRRPSHQADSLTEGQVEGGIHARDPGPRDRPSASTRPSRIPQSGAPRPVRSAVAAGCARSPPTRSRIVAEANKPFRQVGEHRMDGVAASPPPQQRSERLPADGLGDRGGEPARSRRA